MVILGINQVSGLLIGQHDGAAALIKDGKLIATAEEERFNRIRHAKGFPTLAVDYCLKEAGLTQKDIDVIAIGYNPSRFLRRGFFFMNAQSAVIYIATIFLYRINLAKFARGCPKARIVYIDHHLAHAASAYRCSTFKNATVVTVDGAGEIECAALHEGRNGKLTRLDEIPIAKWYDTGVWRSIGKVYSRVTMVLGLGANGEGKTMGLASYGTPKYDFSTILDVQSFDKWTVDRRGVTKLYGHLARKNPKDPLTQDHKDLAASLQLALEKAFVNLAKDGYMRTGLRHVALAGGCALNCNANSRVLSQEFVDQIFVQPASHDGGVALGAALEAMHLVGDGDFVEFIHAYWGPGFTNEEIERLLKNAKVKYRKSKDVVGDTADLIVKGKIVGWFQGRSELGPRALGNRSILADPGIKGINNKVNEDIKHREVWRPFAPSVTVESAPTYFEGMEKAKESPFMLQTFYVREKYRSVLPAITHVDGSSRIQTVSKEQNPRYYELLQALEKRTGRAIVLNTSFNDAGEPIVNSPFDAIRCYFATGFDALAIGDFILEK